jgi:hypothetical protein
MDSTTIGPARASGSVSLRRTAMTERSTQEKFVAVRRAGEQRTEPLLGSLPPRTVACAVCGIACSGGDREVVRLGRHRVTLGRCGNCTELDGPDVCGLVLGLDRNVLSGVQPGPISALQYAEHARPGKGTVEPWSHLTRGDLANARRAVAQAQRRRVLSAQPPIHVAPPGLDDSPGSIVGGCLLCGVGTVLVSALVADGLDRADLGMVTWRHTITSGLTPTTVRGWVCPDDVAMLDEEGAVGVSLVARCLRRVGLLEGDVLPARLPSWAWMAFEAQRQGRQPPPPNERPWEHVGKPIMLLEAGWPPPLVPSAGA